MNLDCRSGDSVKREIPVHFKNRKDFRNRIAGLWQDQKDDELYVFTFGDKESEQDWIDLLRAFNMVHEHE